MKKTIRQLECIIFLCLIFLLGSCQGVHIGPIGNAGSLPEKEIVFQRVHDINIFSSPGERRLGFVDAEGNAAYSNLNQIPMVPPVYPMYTSDNTLLVFNAPRGRGFMSTIDSQGNLVEYNLIGVHKRVTPINNTHEAVIVTMDKGGSPEEIPYSLRRLDLVSGELLQTYLTTQPDGRTITLLDIGTHVLHDQELVFLRSFGIPRRYEIVLLDVVSQQETALIESTTRLSGPAFSPDGQWIAYGNVDGLYILNRMTGGSVPSKIVDAVSSERAPLLPSWSSDGEWLVYHDCLQDCYEKLSLDHDIEDFAIFKVNVATGEKTLLVEGGVNPFWRNE